VTCEPPQLLAFDFVADPVPAFDFFDADPVSQYDADPDPQHCWSLSSRKKSWPVCVGFYHFCKQTSAYLSFEKKFTLSFLNVRHHPLNVLFTF
jgi:hypothetical protein